MPRNTIEGARKMIVKKAIIEAAEYEKQQGKSLQPGTGAYSDLMHNVEMQVQAVLEKEGYIEF